MELSVGTRVIIKNLSSKPELNGTIAVVLAPTLEEVEQLQSRGRVKVSGCFKSFSVKRENLKLIDEKSAPRIDWSLLDGPEKDTSDIVNIIRFQDFGNLTYCTRFVESLVDYINHDGVMIPSHIYDASHPQVRQLLLNNITPHSIYIFRCDHIGHHFVLEVQSGKARLFQSFYQSERREESGYSAREWINPTPCEDWEEELKAVQREFGGGKELSYLQYVKILDILLEIQQVTEAIARQYRSILPKWLVEAEDEWEAQLKPKVASRSPIGKWYDHCFTHAWMVTMILMPNDEVLVQSNDFYDKPFFRLTFPPELATPYINAVQKLHGKKPNPINFLMIFGFRLWRTVMRFDPKSQMAVPFGWSYSAITIPH